MGFKEQLIKLKENWLIIALIVVVFVFMMGGTAYTSILSPSKFASDAGYANERYGGGYYPPSPSNDFAPDVAKRVIIKTASLAVEIERGTFDASATQLKGIITSSDSIVLNENVNRYGEKGKEYRQGSYQLKVPVKKYDAVVEQLKTLGDVTSFNENALDVTGESVDLATELATEQARLARYNTMLKEATYTQDKIQLSDKIFDQERRIAYLEDRVENMDEQVDYATVSFSLNEKPSEYQNIAIAKFSALWRTLVGSMNALLYFAFAILPWAAVAGIVVLVWRFFHKG